MAAGMLSQCVGNIPLLFDARIACSTFTLCSCHHAAQTSQQSWLCASNYAAAPLGPLLQAFARLSAVYGGTYMLAKPDVEVVYGEDGAAVGVTSEGETAKAKFIVGDPTYFREKVRGVWLAGLGVLELWAGWVWQEPQAGGWAFWVKLQIWQVTGWLR